nr:hypothetical protein [Staphylococcus agnetis]
MDQDKKHVIPRHKYKRKRREFFHNDEREARIKAEEEATRLKKEREKAQVKNNEERVKDNLRKARISMSYNKANGPTYKEVKKNVSDKAVTREHYNKVTGNSGFIIDGKRSYQFASTSPKDKVIKLYRIDLEG